MEHGGVGLYLTVRMIESEMQLMDELRVGTNDMVVGAENRNGPLGSE